MTRPTCRSRTASAGTLVASKPSVVIGAASSSVSLNVVDTFADNKIVEISPANTAVDLSGYSPWYFRTAPPDTIQGNALGTLISTDGYQKIAFLVFNDTYGTGLRNAVEETVEAAGGECVYGCKGDGDEFPAGQTTFSAEVGGALASNPDAIVILAFDETKSIVPELNGAGLGHDEDLLLRRQHRRLQRGLRAGHPRGRPGHASPAPTPTQAFKDRLSGWYSRPRARTLTDYSYGAESYDATILAALAAVKGGDTDSRDRPEEPGCRLGCHRRRGVHHLRRLCRPARRRQGDPLHRSFGHRSDRRRERPVVGVRRHLQLRRRQQEQLTSTVEGSEG